MIVYLVEHSAGEVFSYDTVYDLDTNEDRNLDRVMLIPSPLYGNLKGAVYHTVRRMICGKMLGCCNINAYINNSETQSK